MAVAGAPELHLRSGADITLHLPGGRDLRLLAVHLKQGCQYLPLLKSDRRACVELRDALRRAIDAGIVPDTLGADMHGYNTYVPPPPPPGGAAQVPSARRKFVVPPPSLGRRP